MCKCNQKIEYKRQCAYNLSAYYVCKFNHVVASLTPLPHFPPRKLLQPFALRITMGVAPLVLKAAHPLMPCHLPHT